MPPLLRSRTLSVSIDCSPARVYAFVRNVENLPRWAGGLASAVRKGVVTLAPGVDILNPMRVVANGSGSEVSFTLFQLPGTSAEKFAEDAGLVERDLRALKRVLEGEAR